MSTTGTIIITDSLAELQVVKFGQVSTADLYSGSLRELNRIVDSWAQERLFVQKSDGSTITVFDLTTPYTLAAGWDRAITKTLAVRLAAALKFFFKVPEPLIAELAAESAEAISNLQGASIPVTPADGSAAAFITDGLYDLGCLFPGMSPSADLLNTCLRAANDWLDAQLIDELMIPASPAQVFTLTAGLQFYTIGPNETAPNFTAARPTQIEQANILLNTVNPVIRTPLNIIEVDVWANIALVDLPQTLPTLLYYEKSFNVNTGASRILIWGGAINNYGLELYSWDQTVLRQFTDLTTAYKYPPGYKRMLQKNIAVAMAPRVAAYAKSNRSNGVLAPSPAMLQLVAQQAMESKEAVTSYNAPSPTLTCDPAFQGSGSANGWNYLLGTIGRNNGRGGGRG